MKTKPNKERIAAIRRFILDNLPARFLDLQVRGESAHGYEFRELDRALQALRKAGQIKFKGGKGRLWTKTGKTA